MSIRLNGATSGSIEIDVPAVAGTDTAITIPATTGGEFIVSDSAGDVNIDSGTLYVDAGNDRVGIGTTSPSVLVDCEGNSSSEVALHLNNVEASGANTILTSTGSTYSYADVGSGTSWLTTGGTKVAVGPYTAGSLQFINGDEKARIDSSGRFGIGTSSPDRKLHVAGDWIRVDDGYGLDTSGGTEKVKLDNGYIALTTASTERMRITSAGFAKHKSTGSYGSTSGTYHEFNSGTSGSAICQFFHRSSNNPYGLIIKFTDSAPDNNSVYFINCVDSTNTVRFKVWSDGDCDNHDNSYGSTSDEKLKQDIVDATSQLDDIKDLRIRKFKFKSDVEAYGDEAKTLIGVVAQEAETVSPGLIKNNPDLDDEGNDLGTVTKSVRYSVLYMKAVKALQEAMERIETLETQNASFEARLAALEGGTTE